MKATAASYSLLAKLMLKPQYELKDICRYPRHSQDKE